MTQMRLLINPVIFKKGRLSGPRKAQAVFFQMKVDGCMIMNGLDVMFYYRPYKWTFWESYWTVEEDTLMLSKSRVEIFWEE